MRSALPVQPPTYRMQWERKNVCPRNCDTPAAYHEGNSHTCGSSLAVQYPHCDVEECESCPVARVSTACSTTGRNSQHSNHLYLCTQLQGEAQDRPSIPPPSAQTKTWTRGSHQEPGTPPRPPWLWQSGPGVSMQEGQGLSSRLQLQRAARTKRQATNKHDAHHEFGVLNASRSKVKAEAKASHQ